MKQILKNKYELIFAISALLLFTLMLFVEINNGKFQTEDFKVFYLAAKALFNNEQVYGVPFGLSTGFYKYSPFILFVFSPYTLLSYKVAALIHFYIISFSAVFSVFLMGNIVEKYLIENNKAKLLTYFLILISILLHLVRDLHMGNTNMILILFLILAVKYFLESKEIFAGLFIALAVLTKPYFIVLVLPFLLFRKYKVFLYTGFFGVLLTLSTVLFLGISKSVNMHLEWFAAMLKHSDYLYSPYTFFYLVDYYFGIEIPKSFTYPFFILMTVFISILFWYYGNKKQKNNLAIIISYFLLIAIIPNLLITDVEHFIFTMPVISVLIFYLRKNFNLYLLLIFISAILMYGGNSSDIVGNELSMKIKFWGFVGIGNIILLSLIIYLFFKKSDNFKN